MNNRFYLIIALVIVLMVGLNWWSKSSTPRIAFVRSSELVEKYKGMNEARELYKEKMARWQSNVDTLSQDYRNSLNKFNKESLSLSRAEQEERKDFLQKQEANIQQYVAELEEKSRQEDAKLTQGVINQINSYVKEYGVENGYDLILGVTLDGNILYGRDAIDVTDKVLEGLNQTYKLQK